jgi:hypothetical protein
MRNVVLLLGVVAGLNLASAALAETRDDPPNDRRVIPASSEQSDSAVRQCRNVCPQTGQCLDRK